MMRMLVWYAIGVANARLAPNRTASTIGSAGMPSWVATLTAIGVLTAAAAVFDEKFVISAANAITAASAAAGGRGPSATESPPPSQAAAPVSRSALPSA